MRSSTANATLSQTFLVGLMALLPLALTITAIAWCVSLLEQFLGPDSSIGSMLIAMGLSFIDQRIVAYVIGIVLVLLFILTLGVLLQRSLAVGAQGLFDGLIKRIPIVGHVYDLADRFVGVLGSKDDPAIKSMEPAWCFFGGDGGTAVLALLPNPEPVRINGYDYFGILVPSAPVPVGGGLLFVPSEWVKPAGFGVEGLTSIYVTMGVSAPKILGGAAQPEGLDGEAAKV